MAVSPQVQLPQADFELDQLAVVSGLESFRILTHVFPKRSVSFQQGAAGHAA